MAQRVGCRPSRVTALQPTCGRQTRSPPQLEQVLVSASDSRRRPLDSPGRIGPDAGGRAATTAGGVMIAKLRVLAALCALVAAVIVLGQSNPGEPLQVRASDIP